MPVAGSIAVHRRLAQPRLAPRESMRFEKPLRDWTREALAGEMQSAFGDRERCEAIGLAPAAVSNLWMAWQERAPGLYWSRLWSLFTLLHWTRAQGLTL